MEKLNLVEMSEIAGGVTQKQYCRDLVKVLASRSDERDWEHWRIADHFYQIYCVK